MAYYSPPGPPRTTPSGRLVVCFWQYGDDAADAAQNVGVAAAMSVGLVLVTILNLLWQTYSGKTLSYNDVFRIPDLVLMCLLL